MRSLALSWLVMLGAVATAGPARGQEHPHHATHHAGHPGAAAAAPVAAPASPAIVELGGNQYNAYYNTNYNSYWSSPGLLTVGYGGFGYRPFYRFGGWSGGGFGPYAYPPLMLPAQTLFGPQPVQQMMGANPAAPAAAGGPIQAPPDAAPRPPRKVRVANAEAKARAGKFIDFGDALFAKQRFREALERYKLAAQQAPDMAEIYLRQGISSVATGQYESAGRYFRRALKMDGWDAAHLQLDQLYGADRIAKEAHLEALAMAIQAAGHDANLLFVLGMELQLGGQPERAAAFFTRAAQLGGNEDHLLDGFGPVARPVAPQPNANPAAL